MLLCPAPDNIQGISENAKSKTEWVSTKFASDPAFRQFTKEENNFIHSSDNYFVH